MISRGRLLRAGSGDFRTTAKIADEFQHVLLRNRWTFDHVAVDVGYLCATASRFTRDLIGHERDTEACNIIQKQLQSSVLRRVGGSKSLALMLDGSEPLWKVQHMRIHPGRKFPEKFYRSAASPMVYMLEERLLAMAPDTRPPPSEFIISGAGVPGPAEGKMSAWVLDLATRIPHPATNPPHAPQVTPNDSVCFVGGTDLFLNVLGATPFHKVTAVTLNAGEIRSLSLSDCLSWLGLADLLSPCTGGEDAHAQQQQRLAAVRTDVVLLYLLTNGISCTGLAGLGGISFAEVMEGYLDELKSFTPAVVTGAAGTKAGAEIRYFSGMLFDEHPLMTPRLARHAGDSDAAPAPPPLPSLRLKPDALARVLTRAVRRPVNYPARPCVSSANYLEVLLQSHAMVTSGGVQNLGWVPPNYGDSIPEKPPKIPLDQFIGHLRAAAATVKSSGGPAPLPPAYVCPTRSRSFALTGIESLLLTSPEAAVMDQVVPMYARGHAMPPGVSADIAHTRHIHEALAKTRTVLAGLAAEGEDHPAIAHHPTHYLVRAAAARGPPPGWSYHSVNLGTKAEAMNIRYSLNASDAALLREVTSAAESGLSKRNCMFVYDADTQAWRETPCEELNQPGRASGDSGPAGEATGADARLATLRVLTWNTQFDRHSGERTPLGRDGIDWCTRTRYLALSKVLAAMDADVVAMQEVEAAWCAFLAEQAWVRERYVMSCQPHSHAISPWGVLMLVRRGLSVRGFDHANVPAFSGHTSAMPEVTIGLGPESPAVTVGSMHLLAPYSQSNVSNRETQLANLLKHLQSPARGGAAGTYRVVMGDFNDYPVKLFRFPAELGFKDAWEELHPRCNELARATPPSSTTPAEEETRAATEERGYTIDGTANPYAGRIIEPEFFGRPDRVMYAAAGPLQPVHAELVGTGSVAELLAEDGVTHLVERPGEVIPSYLRPSDHFGVLVEFQVL